MLGIALIGPPGGDAPAVGARLARRLGRPHITLDAASPFELEAVERAVSDFPGAVLSLAADAATHADAASGRRVRAALHDWVVVLLTPALDADGVAIDRTLVSNVVATGRRPIDEVVDDVERAWWGSAR
jgi:hypothetical protein